MREVKRKRLPKIEMTTLDKVINYLSPVRGRARMHARFQMAIAGGYTGARKDRRETQNWITRNYDPDSVNEYDLDDLRTRSRDLIRNNPIATGAIGGTVTSVIGTGLKLRSRIDREVLNISVEAADNWERQAQREFALWADNCDITGILNFAGLQELIFRQVLENGEAFVVLPRVEITSLIYSLKLQIIEADRITNENNASNTASLTSGVEKDKNGKPKNYHILKTHPGNTLVTSKREWNIIPAYGTKTGLKNIIHLYRQLRPGQTRGIPYLAPVIETLKQLSRYTEAELMGAVISSLFTVAITTPQAEGGFVGNGTAADDTGTGKKDKPDILLDTGNVVELLPGEEIKIIDSSRPNTAFDPFVEAITRQIGMALELPFEVLIKHFSSSFSASKAALLEAGKFYNNRRRWLSDNFCQVVYESVITEAITLSRLPAPGFFDDPLIKKAYLGARWTGDAYGQLDPIKEVKAAGERLDRGITTLEEETITLTGGDWERNHPQQAKEHRMRKEADLLPSQQATENKDDMEAKDDNEAT